LGISFLFHTTISNVLTPTYLNNTYRSRLLLSSNPPPQDSGNKVSRRAAITGTANITLGGRTVIMADVQLRGDLHPTRSAPSQSGRETTPISINIGKCTVISTGSVIKPPARISRGQVHYYPMKIGDNVFVGA
jgi:dynactin-5